VKHYRLDAPLGSKHNKLDFTDSGVALNITKILSILWD